MTAPRFIDEPQVPQRKSHYVDVIDYPVEDPLGGEGTYTGSLSQLSGEPCGKGRLDFSDGVSHYDGEFIHGIWAGRGNLKNQQGDCYSGYFLDNLRHGEGTMRYSDGRCFKGLFERDALVEGIMYYHDGATYEGQFKHGKRSGKGVYCFRDGSVYEGSWKNDQYHGVGELQWSNGARFFGEWRHGIKHGFGREFDAGGDIRHKGIWRDGFLDVFYEVPQ